MKYEQHFIFENQLLADGKINTQPIVTRSSLASGLSYYYERCSKMVMTDLYPQVAITLCDAQLNVIEHQVIDTQYVATTTEE